MQKAAILLSIYNGSCYVEEQVDSIFSQSSGCWQLFVRDDRSIDGSLDIVRRIESSFPFRIKVVSDPYGSVGACNSFSILLSSARESYIMFCDQDDVWLPDKIRKTLDVMQAAEVRYGAETPLLVHTDLCVVDDRLHSVASSFWKYQNLDPKLGTELNRLIVQNVVTGCTVMINRPLADLAADVPEDAIMHDWWIALVAAAFGKIVFLDEATILYRQHGNNSVGAKRWGLKRILHQAKSSAAVCDSMLKTMWQAQALLDRFRDRMSAEQVTMVETYASLPYMSKYDRLRAVLKFNFYKQGIIRNIGFIAHLLLLPNPSR